jgi:hypothetical protein
VGLRSIDAEELGGSDVIIQNHNDSNNPEYGWFCFSERVARLYFNWGMRAHFEAYVTPVAKGDKITTTQKTPRNWELGC